MSGLPLVIGSTEPWDGGQVGDAATCVLAPNPSAMTLDGTNTWLLGSPGTGTAVLVDPGPADPDHLQVVVRTLAERELGVSKILLTHGHLDHSEGSRLFSRELGAPVLALDPDLRLGSEGLSEGVTVRAGDLEIEVVATPGHSSDSLSFLLREQGAILTGDTILGRGTTVVAYPDGSLSDYLDSLERLTELVARAGATSLLPGHGPVVADPAQILADYITHRHARLEQVRQAIADGARSPMDVVDRVYRPIPEEVVPAALASTRAQWDYLRSR